MKLPCACRLVAPALAVFAPPAAFADWSGKGEAGVVIASGNSDIQNFNAKVALAKDLPRWKNSFAAAAVYASSDNDTTSQRWETFGQSDYKLGERNFVFGSGRYEVDEFSGFEYQATLAAGVGRHFVLTETTKLTGAVGPGYKVFETRDAFDDTGVLLQPGDSDSEAVLRASLDLEHAVTANSKLTNKLLVEGASENTFVSNDLAFTVKFSDVFAMAAGFSVRYNTDPPIGFEDVDTLTTLNLVYEIL